MPHKIVWHFYIREKLKQTLLPNEQKLEPDSYRVCDATGDAQGNKSWLQKN
jgi:hypothetical protein